MKMYIYNEDMELIERALRHEVELLKMMDHDRLLSYSLVNAESLLDRWLFMKRIYGYRNVSKLI